MQTPTDGTLRANSANPPVSVRSVAARLAVIIAAGSLVSAAPRALPLPPQVIFGVWAVVMCAGITWSAAALKLGWFPTVGFVAAAALGIAGSLFAMMFAVVGVQAMNSVPGGFLLALSAGVAVVHGVVALILLLPLISRCGRRAFALGVAGFIVGGFGLGLVGTRWLVLPHFLERGVGVALPSACAQLAVAWVRGRTNDGDLLRRER